MKIEIEIDETAIQEKVVEKVVAQMNFEAREVLHRMIKEAIVGEIRTAIKAEAAEILKTLTLPDGRTLRRYVEDRIQNVKTRSGWRAEQLGVEGLINSVVEENSKNWFKEIVDPRLNEIKSKIREQIVNKLLNESGNLSF